MPKKSEHSVFVEFCWYFLLFESAENSLILLLLFPLRLYSKVTGQNAVPDYCRSPLPISTDHSMLPDITGVKLCSIRPIRSEYPFPDPLVFIWSLLVSTQLWMFSFTSTKPVSIRSGGETEPWVSPVCKRDGEIQELGSSCFPVLKPLQKELSKTSGFSLVLVCKGFKLLSLELSLGYSYVGTVPGWDSPILWERETK